MNYLFSWYLCIDSHAFLPIIEIDTSIAELFQILQAHAVEKLTAQRYQEPVATLHDSESSLVVSKENTVGLISLDVARTFPALCIFQKVRNLPFVYIAELLILVHCTRYQDCERYRQINMFHRETRIFLLTIFVWHFSE